MSFLAWAFGLSALAIGFPLIFHLIRRTPRGRQEFSSLMFLKASPPRLTRRSRLDNWFLLLLRALAIIFLAIAFMRPFLRDNVAITGADVPGRRVAILIDTSASMRSGKSWNQAAKEMDRVLRKLDSSDDIALFTFDRQVRTLVDFESEASVVPAEKRDLVRAEFSKLKPTWYSTDLATALITIADSMDVKDEINKNKSALQMIVISDMQNGSRIDSLQSYQWPESVRVDIRQVDSGLKTNASVRILQQKDQQPDQVGTRVRVSNAAGSENDQFVVNWTDADGNVAADSSIPFYVPAGTSRVLQIDRPPQQLASDRLVLDGDENDFDNLFYTTPTERRTLNLIYFGDEAIDDANHMFYFLKSALGDDHQRKIAIRQVRSDETLEPEGLNELDAELVFVTREIDADSRRWLESHLKDRGTVFFVARNEAELKSFEPFVGEYQVEKTETAPPRSREDYSLLADIDFGHPLFSPFANPRYNDFTRIHFWKHLRLSEHSPALASESTHVIAEFVDRSPALLQRASGKGQTYLMTSGWEPEQSELALSTKFVPMMNLLLQNASLRPQIEENCLVGQPFVLPQFESNLARQILRPDGRTESIATEDRVYRNTDMPGIFAIQAGDKTYPFAVNLPASESDTTAMPLEKLQMHNVLLGRQASQATRLEQMQLLKDKELENRQKIWKWLAVGAFLFLILETFLAGLIARRSSRANTNNEPISSGVVAS